jgi:hypothetical protein
MNMKKIISICAECKKELTMAKGAVIEQCLASWIQNEEIVYSHGICFECGVKLYGDEIMAAVSTKMNHALASLGVPKVTKNETSFGEYFPERF